MGLNESASFVVSSILSVLTFSAMQVLKPTLASSKPMTLAGGFLGSLLFVFLLTAVGNLERCLFGKGFATKVFEVVVCILLATSAAASVHRVCATTCVLLSLLMLHGVFKISQEVYGSGAAPTSATGPSSASGGGEKRRKK